MDFERRTTRSCFRLSRNDDEKFKRRPRLGTITREITDGRVSPRTNPTLARDSNPLLESNRGLAPHRRALISNTLSCYLPR